MSCFVNQQLYCKFSLWSNEYQLLLTERSTILNDAFTGHSSQASFSRNMRSSSILDLWYVLKYFTVCVLMESWRSSDALPQNSSPTAINLQIENIVWLYSVLLVLLNKDCCMSLVNYWSFTVHFLHTSCWLTFGPHAQALKRLEWVGKWSESESAGGQQEICNLPFNFWQLNVLLSNQKPAKCTHSNLT